jgi:hypothetical protein
MLSNLSPDKRLRPPVQLGNPSLRVQARRPVAGLDLPTLVDAQTDPPGCATTLTDDEPQEEAG